MCLALPEEALEDDFDNARSPCSANEERSELLLLPWTAVVTALIGLIVDSPTRTREMFETS